MTALATSPANTGWNLRLAAADQGQRRRDPRERGEAVEEIVLGPEHDGWPEE